MWRVFFSKDVYEKRQTRLQSHFSKRSHLKAEPMVSLMHVGQLKRGFQKYRNGTSVSISYRIATTVTKPKTRKKKLNVYQYQEYIDHKP